MSKQLEVLTLSRKNIEVKVKKYQPFDTLRYMKTNKLIKKFVLIKKFINQVFFVWCVVGWVDPQTK